MFHLLQEIKKLSGGLIVPWNYEILSSVKLANEASNLFETVDYINDLKTEYWCMQHVYHVTH